MHKHTLRHLLTFAILASTADAAAYCLVGAVGAVILLAACQAELFARWARGR